MIDFERVEDALRMLKKQESLALEDVLGVYLDLCEALEGWPDHRQSADRSDG